MPPPQSVVQYKNRTPGRLAVNVKGGKTLIAAQDTSGRLLRTDPRPPTVNLSSWPTCSWG